MATANVPAFAGGNLVVGKVMILYGTVKAIAPDGTVRMLAPNSPIFANDRIVTEGDGSVSMMMDSMPPAQMDLGRMSSVLIDEDVYAGVAPHVTTDAAAEAEQIQQALLAGEAPIDLEAPAAGGAAGAGGTHPLYVVNLTGAEVIPVSGAGTIGVSYGTVNPLDAVSGQQQSVAAPVVTIPITNTITITAPESVPEGSQFDYTATLAHAAQGDISVVLSNGAHIDIPTGATSGTVTVSAPPDNVYITPSTVTATIAGASGGGTDTLVINPAPAVTAITDTINTTFVAITADNVTENDPNVTFSIHLSNPPQTGSVASVDVLIHDSFTNITTTQTVAIDAQGNGTLIYASAHPDVYVDPSSITATVTAVHGGNFEATSVAGATATAHISDVIDTTIVTLSAPAEVVEGDKFIYTATVDHAPQGNLVITLNDAAHTTITILDGQFSGTSEQVTAPNVPDGGSHATVGVASTTGGNYEHLDTSSTVQQAINDHVPTLPVNDSVTVYEAAIPGIGSGTESGAHSYIANGTFIDNANWGADGFGGIVSVNGVAPVNGTITITDAAWVLNVNSATGAYEFTLLGNVLADPAGNNGANIESMPTFAVVGQDADGSKIGFDLNVNIVDDTPTVHFDNSIGPDTATTFTGTWSAAIGADALPSMSDYVKGIVLNSVQVDGVNATFAPGTYDSATDTYSGSFTYNGDTTVTFSLTLVDSANYTLKLGNAITSVVITPNEYAGAVHAAGPTDTYLITYHDTTTNTDATATASVVASGAPLTLSGALDHTGTGHNTYTATTTGSLVNASGDGIGIDNNVISSFVGNDNVLTAESLKYMPQYDASAITLNFKATGDVGFGTGGSQDVIYVEAHEKGGGTHTIMLDSRYGDFLVNSDGSLTEIHTTVNGSDYTGGSLTSYTISSDIWGGNALITDINVTAGFYNDSHGIQGSDVKVSLGFATETPTTFNLPLDMNFTTTVTDADGDLAASTFSVQSTAGTTLTAALAVNSVITGTAGDDTLHGTAGSDTFMATKGADHITDYHKIIGGEHDVVDISGLVANATKGNLSVSDDHGHAKLTISDGGVEKGSITFDNITSAEAPDLNSLLGHVDVKDSTHHLS